MKRGNKFILGILTLMAAFFASCENKWPVNDGLDANWQMMKVLYNDGSSFDVKDKQLYWAFRKNLMQLSSNERFTPYQKMYARFQKNEYDLEIYDFVYGTNNETDADNNAFITPSELDTLMYWYISPSVVDSTHLRVKYKILELSDELILKNEDVKIIFRKF